MFAQIRLAIIYGVTLFYVDTKMQSHDHAASSKVSAIRHLGPPSRSCLSLSRQDHVAIYIGERASTLGEYDLIWTILRA